MLQSVAKAAQSLAVWRLTEKREVADEHGAPLSHADSKAAEAHAYENFARAAYEVALELAPRLAGHDPVITKSHVRYSTLPGGGGFVVQKTEPGSPGPGVVLELGKAETTNWLQLMIDLPELLETLEVR